MKMTKFNSRRIVLLVQYVQKPFQMVGPILTLPYSVMPATSVHVCPLAKVVFPMLRCSIAGPKSCVDQTAN